jgi:hypothetical protein
VADFALRGSLDIDASRFVSGLRDAGKAGTDLVTGMERGADDIGAAFDGLEDAGKRYGDTIGKSSAEADDAMRRTASIAEALGTAIGPELRAAVGQSGIDTLAADLDRAGMSADDVRANAAQLEAQFRDLADAADRAGTAGATGTNRIGAAMDDTAKRTDNTRSVVANFAGNTASELPGVTGAFGPLNMAIGQFGEYATEGNIRLKSLVTAGAGLAVVTGAMMALNSQIDRMNSTKNWRREEVDAFAESIREGEDAAEGLADRLEDAGRITFAFGSGFKGDVLPTLAAAGVTVEDFTEAATGGADRLALFEDALRTAGVQGNDFALIMAAARSYADNYAEAQGKAADFQSVFNARVADGTSTLDLMVPSLTASETAADDYAAAAERVRDRQQEATDKARDARIAVYELRDGYAALRGELSIEDQYANVEEGFDRVKVAAEEAYVAAATGADDAEAKGRELEQGTRDQQRAVIDYLEDIGRVPDQVTSSILALIDEGKFAEAEARLAVLARNREFRISVTSQGRDFRGNLSDLGYASGGAPPPGRTVSVGEAGIELATFGSPAYITPTHAVTSALYTMGMSPPTAPAAPVIVEAGLRDGDRLQLVVGGDVFDATVRRANAHTGRVLQQGMRI